MSDILVSFSAIGMLVSITWAFFVSSRFLRCVKYHKTICFQQEKHTLLQMIISNILVGFFVSMGASASNFYQLEAHSVAIGGAQAAFMLGQTLLCTVIWSLFAAFAFGFRIFLNMRLYDDTVRKDL